MQVQRIERTRRLCRYGLVLLSLAGLSACSGGGASRNNGLAGNPAGPVQLGRGLQSGASASVVVSIDEVEARKAIENYRINKKRAAGPYELVGVDLNGDGIGEAMVLFAGKDWCTSQGCSLAILQSGTHGFRPMSRTVRVKAPVVVSVDQTNGWRDLFVSTGGAGSAPLRRVRLRFSANGYSRNAMLEEELPPDLPQTGETVIGEPPSPAAQLSGSSRASNP